LTRQIPMYVGLLIHFTALLSAVVIARGALSNLGSTHMLTVKFVSLIFSYFLCQTLLLVHELIHSCVNSGSNLISFVAKCGIHNGHA
jgi:hypothetical protein